MGDICLHTRKGTSVAVEITQAIERLERVYTFDKKCVDAVKNLTGISHGRLEEDIFTSTHYKDLPKLRPPKEHKLSEKQVHEIRN